MGCCRIDSLLPPLLMFELLPLPCSICQFSFYCTLHLCQVFVPLPCSIRPIQMASVDTAASWSLVTSDDDDSHVPSTALVQVGPRPPPPRPDTVKVLEYYWGPNDPVAPSVLEVRRVGTLYLLRRGNGTQQCAWWSKRTDIMSAWHGQWHQFPNGATVCLFDFRGREEARKHTVIYRDGKGSDYRGRAIQVVQTAFWQWDSATLVYVRRDWLSTVD